MYFVEANGNGEEGIDYEEDDDFAGGGDLVTTMFQVTANGNGANGGDAGLKIREKGDGNLSASLHQIETSDNVIGGISVREDAQGNLDSDISYATSLANGGHGIDFDENRANTSDVGNLTASVSHSTSSNNIGAGVRADQQTPGTGTLSLTNVTLENNAGGATTGEQCDGDGAVAQRPLVQTHGTLGPLPRHAQVLIQPLERVLDDAREREHVAAVVDDVLLVGAQACRASVNIGTCDVSTGNVKSCRPFSISTGVVTRGAKLMSSISGRSGGQVSLNPPDHSTRS